ncbi:MAG: hypothetical protein ACOX3R_14270 [Desulfitobacteriia bacterium]
MAVYSPQEVRIIFLAFFLLLLFRLWFWWKPKDFVGRLSRPEILLLVCSLAVGYVYGLSAEKSLAEALVIEEVQIEGRLKDWVQNESSGQGILLIRKAEVIKKNPGTARKARAARTTRSAETARIGRCARRARAAGRIGC